MGLVPGRRLASTVPCSIHQVLRMCRQAHRSAVLDPRLYTVWTKERSKQAGQVWLQVSLRTQRHAPERKGVRSPPTVRGKG